MKCPGQDSRYWKSDAIFETECPKCSNVVEFFKDDTLRVCRNCGHRFLNPGMDFGCASYCQYAEQCIGNLPPELVALKDNLLKDRAAIEMKRHSGQDFKRIAHATRVARYAEEIGKAEKANLAVVLSAAYLHCMGNRNENEKQQGSGCSYGPDVSSARNIMARLGANENLAEEVCDIVGKLNVSSSEETINYKCVHDADVIAVHEEAGKENIIPYEHIKDTLINSLFTGSGRELASRMFLMDKQ